MTTRIQFTDTKVWAIEPQAKRIFVWDKTIRNLGVEVSPRGHRTWVIRALVDGAAKRRKLGSFPGLSTDDARRAALATLGDVARGERSEVFKERTELKTVQALVDFYVQGLPDGSAARYMLGRLPKEWRVRLTAVKPEFVAKWLRDTGCIYAPSFQKNLISYLKAGWNVGLKTGVLRLPNPFLGADLPRSVCRSRVLNERQTQALLWSLDTLDRENPLASKFFRLLYLTGMRFNEARCLKWEHISWDEKELRIIEHKTRNRTGADKIVPLNDKALAALGQRQYFGYVFPSPKFHGRAVSKMYLYKQWDEVKRKARMKEPDNRNNLNKVVLHNMKSNLVSRAVEAGLDVHRIARLTGNSPATLSRHYVQVSKRKVRDDTDTVGDLL